MRGHELPVRRPRRLQRGDRRRQQGGWSAGVNSTYRAVYRNRARPDRPGTGLLASSTTGSGLAIRTPAATTSYDLMARCPVTSREMGEILSLVPADFADPQADYLDVRAMLGPFHGHPVPDHVEVTATTLDGVRCRLRPTTTPTIRNNERVAFHCHGVDSSPAIRN